MEKFINKNDKSSKKKYIDINNGDVLPNAVKHTIDCELHGLRHIKFQKRLRQSPIPEKYKTYCPLCRDFYLSEDYVPTEKDIQDCREFLNNYKFINSKNHTEKYFRKYVPRFYKVIRNHNIDGLNLSFSYKIWAFKNNVNEIPKCKVNKCDNDVEILKTGSHFGFTMFCTDHRYNFCSSDAEKEILDYVKQNYNGEVFSNYRKIGNRELDIYIPKLKLGIEFNGLYWHSDLFKDKNYHQNKFKIFKEEGIQLLAIWEDDWSYKNDIIKSIIHNKLKINSLKLNARDCNIKNVEYNDAKEFLIKNHIQGNTNGSIRLGLFHNDELVSLMTFGSRRKILGQRSEKGSYELLRFCNKNYTSVRGSASKLLKYFIDNYIPESIVSYANLDISDGKLYEILGFENKGYTEVNYWWAKGLRSHRSNFMKHKLIKEGADPRKTENEIMKERGYVKIYGVGNIKYVLTPLKTF